MRHSSHVRRGKSGLNFSDMFQRSQFRARFHQLNVYYFIAIPVAFFATYLIGSLLEKFVISRLYGREIDSLLATWGISLILQQAARVPPSKALWAL